MMSTTVDIIDDRFEVTSKLFDGRLGPTYVARDRTGTHPVVVKFLDIEHIDEWKGLGEHQVFAVMEDEFEPKAEILQQLDHPRIPDYVDYQWDSDAGVAYLAQRRAAGRSISDMLEEGRHFDQEETIDIARQLLEVLDYLNSLQPPVFHRNITPENLYLDGRSVYLVNFAIPPWLPTFRSYDSEIDNPSGYMPPAYNPWKPSASAEIYALGMTLIHMLTARIPRDLNRTSRRPGYRAYVDLSPDFDRLIHRMTSRDSEDRISSPAEAIEMLQRIGTTDRLDADPDHQEDMDSQPEVRGELEARVADRDARKQEKQDAEEAKKKQRKRKIERRRQREDICTKVQKQGPGNWVFEFEPPWGRAIRHYSYGGAIGYFLMTLLGWIILAFGIVALAQLMADTIPVIGDLSLFSNRYDETLGIVGGPLVGLGFCWLLHMLQLPFKSGVTIEIQGDAFSITTPGIWNSEIIGRLDELRVRFYHPRHHRVLGLADFTHRGIGKPTVEYLTPRELQRLHDFLVERGCSCSWSDDPFPQRMGNVN